MYANCHIDEEEIERYSMGAMPEGAIAPFEEHLLICESCQLRLAQSNVYVSAMRQASVRLRSGPLKRRLPWLRFPAWSLPWPAWRWRLWRPVCGSAVWIRARLTHLQSTWQRRAGPLSQPRRRRADGSSCGWIWGICRPRRGTGWKWWIAPAIVSCRPLCPHGDPKPTSRFREPSRESTSCASTGHPENCFGSTVSKSKPISDFPPVE